MEKTKHFFILNMGSLTAFVIIWMSCILKRIFVTICWKIILNLKGKSKDNLKARQDLQELQIRPNMLPFVLPNDKYRLPVAPSNLSVDEKNVIARSLEALEGSRWTCKQYLSMCQFKGAQIV